MNFIYIHTHDTGRFMQPYGLTGNTPALMDLAQESTVFRQMFSAAPTCSPSRAAMLTGMSPHSCGMLGLAHRGFSINDYSHHIGNYLRTQGYYTALYGVQHEYGHKRKDDGTIGYSESTYEVGANDTETDLMNLKGALEFLKNVDSLGKPFFLSFGMRSTHRPWPSGSKYNPDYVVPPHPVADTSDNRKDFCDFLESLSLADHCVGELVSALKRSGLWENSIVLFTTDHGLAYPDMKCTLYDTGTGVAFILHRPGNERKVCNALCSQIDLFPTICDLLGVKKPEWLQGKSMLPLLNGEAEEINDYIFSEVTFHATYEPARCVRSKGYKLIRYFDGGEQRRYSNIDGSVAKNAVIESPLYAAPRSVDNFFDLTADPLERINLAGNPVYEQVYKEHAVALEKWMLETNDPLLGGKGIMKSFGHGAIINRFDQVAPNDEDVIVLP